MSTYSHNSRVSTETFRKMKSGGEKISMLTAYDFTTAKILDNAGIDALLVGDSAANVMLGYSTTLPITLEEMILYAKGVVNATRRAMVVVDMPFGSYQTDTITATASAIKIIKETNAHSVKIEGGEEFASTIKNIVQAGIPVMGHLGLTPQSVHQFGGYAIRAKQEKEAEILLKNAKILQESGCFALVLEKIPASIAKKVTEMLDIPTIGIGAGAFCDGQILVTQDMLGLNPEFQPKFLRKYLDLNQQINAAIKEYIADVKSQDFPNLQESY